jgi:hypothetical protein
MVQKCFIGALTRPQVLLALAEVSHNPVSDPLCDNAKGSGIFADVGQGA